MQVPRRAVLATLIAAPAVSLFSHGVNGQLQSLEGAVPDLGPKLPPPVPPAPAPVPAVAIAPALPPTAPPPAAPAASALLPAWRRNAIAQPVKDGRPAITVIIDDMGWMHPYTERIAALPGPLTLSWFPFAPRLPDQVGQAMARGHETMLHMPMQSHALTTTQTGPDPLRIDIAPEVNRFRLRAAIAAVPSIVGLNNHMGSVATTDPVLMDVVASETKAHGLLFVDSITVAHSVALARAEAAGVPAAPRDIFIDYKNDPATVRGQLELVETTARRIGHVVAIGHPRPHTIDALAAWLPGLAAKGFALWPVSAAVAARNKIDMSAPHAA